MSRRPDGPAPVRPAATVVLARDGGDGIEVLLLERHARSRMSPGAFAFPGGRVEPADAWDDVEGTCRGLTTATAAATLGDGLLGHAAFAYWIAALREAFEETGLLFAYGPDGAPFVPGAAEAPRFAEHRARCRADAGAFRAVLFAERLTLAADRMAYYAHWITPEERPVRYDARFFVAAAFPEMTAEPDGTEAVTCRWFRPAEALAEHGEGRITLPFPTQGILRSIAEQADVAALLASAGRRDIRAIRPRLIRDEGRERLLLPGDAGYF